LLLAGAPAADADDTRPKPPPMTLLSATVEGCQAPCAPDESGVVTVTFERPVRPDSIPPAFVHIRVTGDGQGFHPFSSTSDLAPSPWVYKFRICAEGGPEPYPCVYQRLVDLQGAVSVGYSWDCDEISGECASSSRMSDPSNTLVPTQL
jgi:hypothetical protein